MLRRPCSHCGQGKPNTSNDETQDSPSCETEADSELCRISARKLRLQLQVLDSTGDYFFLAPEKIECPHRHHPSPPSIHGLLMEVGAIYDKKRLHGKKYFNTLLERVEDVPDSVKELLRLSRNGFEMFDSIQKKLVTAVQNNRLIRERVQRLMSIPGVGELTALTWVLEIGEVSRFSSSRQAISYCGLCSGQHESAGKEQRGPISKKRNKHLQTRLIEAAKLAPHWNELLAQLHDKELARGNRNRATLVVARKLVEFMLAVDRRETGFEVWKEAV